MTVRHLQVMAEYDTFPIWDRTPGAARGAIDPESLPLSPQLVKGLWEWNDEYGRLYTENPDAASAPSSRWVHRGRGLATRVQDELGPGYVVTYHP